MLWAVKAKVFSTKFQHNGLSYYDDVVTIREYHLASE